MTCKKCGAVLIVKKTKRTSEQLKKSYYYTAYYFCPNCHRLYHSDEFRVENTSLFLDYSALPQDNIKFDVEIWTDGACKFNGQVNAKAAWAFVSGKIEKAGLVEGKQTNNTAEGLAIYFALVWAVSEKHKKIKIYSDSQISINNLRKSPNMIKENREIFYKIADIIANHKLKVYYEKVLGHSGDVNNERADRLANRLAGIS